MTKQFNPIAHKQTFKIQLNKNIPNIILKFMSTLSTRICNYIGKMFYIACCYLQANSKKLILFINLADNANHADHANHANHGNHADH